MVRLNNMTNTNDELFTIDLSQSNKKTYNFVFVGEEGVGKSSLINYLLQEERAAISDMHTKTWKATCYSIQVNDLIFNYYDIPGIEGKFSDESIAQEFSDKKFDLIICCLDGTRIRPNGMVRKSIIFINKFLPNIPVLFTVTKENLVPLNDKFKINEIKSSVRENANALFKHFGLVAIGNNVSYSKHNKFWRELITCLPEIESNINENFNEHQKTEKELSDHLKDFFTSNYKEIPEISQLLISKDYRIKNLKMLVGFIAYLYVALCTGLILFGADCYQYHIAQGVAVFFVSLLSLSKFVIWIYSTNYYGLFPVFVENVDTGKGEFTGAVRFVSKNKYYTRLDGIFVVGNTTYSINSDTRNCCMFELCNDKYFEKYANVIDV